MVGVTALVVGYVMGQVWPDTFNAAVPSPLFMMLFCIVFPFGVAYIAYRGVTGTTAVNAAINVIQISALIVFSVMAIGYRTSHPEGSRGWTLDPDGNPINVVLAGRRQGGAGQGRQGRLRRRQESGRQRQAVHHHLRGGFGDGRRLPIRPIRRRWSRRSSTTPAAKSVVAPHAFSYMVIQACIAILILVGFESVTSMGEEAKNPKTRHPASRPPVAAHPGGVLLSVRVLCRELLHEQRLPDQQRARIRGADRRHDDHRRARGCSAVRPPARRSCWCRPSRSSWRSSARRCRA